LNSQRPLNVMMIGLQGSGKTTASAKLALWLKSKGEHPALVACDIYRPAAIDQLKILGEQIDVPVFAYGPIPVKEIAEKAMRDAKKANCTVIIYDTAGRLQIDEPLVNEIKELKAQIQPQEILLVLDGALGQEAVNVSKTFNEALALTGVILTKLDGDAKGGAALSMKRAVNLPIKFSGIGEKLEDFEKFYPDRMASRILGMGDIVSLVEKAKEEMDENTVESLTHRLMSGDFNFDDFLAQIQQMKKLGNRGISKWLPNMAMLQNANGYDEEMKRCESFLLSMTKQERQHPNLLNSSYRRARITKGAGRTISDFNKFVKRFQMMKKFAQKLKNADARKLRGLLDSFAGNSSFLGNQNLFKK
jgi:Signal recognition particle GTPase